MATSAQTTAPAPAGGGSINPEAEDEAEALKRNGFLIVDNVLPPGVLHDAQTAFGRVASRFRDDWRRGCELGHGVSENGEYYAAGTFHARRYFDLDVVSLLAEHDALVELVAAPRLLSVLQATVGPDVQATTIQARVLPPVGSEVAAVEGGYVGWHRDHAVGPDWQHGGQPLNIKVIFYLTDSAVGGAATYFVPASHQLEGGPDGSKYLGMGGGPGYDPAGRRQPGEMPGAVPVIAKAGSAALFDTRAWHSAGANIGSGGALDGDGAE